MPLHTRLYRFSKVDLNNTEQKQQLIDIFVNSVHVYDDKVVVSFNYKDGDKCLTFDEIKEMLDKKENAGNHTDYQRSPLVVIGGAYETRTRDPHTASVVRSQLR